jgi:hypothetical protein
MKYQQEIQQWYIEWEPQWEDEHQVRMLGYGKIVDQTLHHLTQEPSHSPNPPKMPTSTTKTARVTQDPPLQTQIANSV